ncbi:MAG: hypothetical protein AAGK00_14990 [Pseudomonadota bacterium]
MNIRIVGAIIAVALIAGGFWFLFEPGLRGITDPIGSGTSDEQPVEGDLADGQTPSADQPSAPRIDLDAMAAQMDAQLQEQDLSVFKALKEHYPQRYDRLVERLAGMAVGGAPAAQIAEISQVFMSDLRKENGEALLQADDDDLVEIVTLSRDLHRQILENEGRAACNQFALAGPPGLGERIFDYLRPLDQQGALLLSAMATASGRPAEVTAATAEDWQVVMDRLIANGGDPKHREALAELAPEADICAALVALLDTTLSMDGAVAARLRATYVRDLAIN